MASETKFNIYFRTFDNPKSCGLYNQNTLIGLIESAFRSVQEDLAPHPKHEAVALGLWCAWDAKTNAKFNRSRLFCDSTIHPALQRKLSEKLSTVGGQLCSLHSQTYTQHANNRGIGVSLFDINGVGVDAYVESVLRNPKAWLEALTSV